MDYRYGKPSRNCLLVAAGVALSVAAIHWLVLDQREVAQQITALFWFSVLIWWYQLTTHCVQLRSGMLRMSKGIFHQSLAAVFGQKVHGTIDLREVAQLRTDGGRLVFEMKDGRTETRSLFTLSADSATALLTALRLAVLKLPSQPQHYLRVQDAMPTETHAVSLRTASVSGPMVQLVFTWRGDKSKEVLDAMDTKVRAFVNCAIADLAIASEIPCREGLSGVALRVGDNSIPIPGWSLGDRNQPTLVAQSAFDMESRGLFLLIGTPHVNINSSDPIAVSLARSAEELLREFTV